MDILFGIGKTSGILLVLFGFVHFLALDALYKSKTEYEYLLAKYWIGKITIGLTIITFGSALGILIIHFLN